MFEDKAVNVTLVVDFIDPKFTQQLFDVPCELKLINIVNVVNSDFSRVKRKPLEAKDLHRMDVCLSHAQRFAIFPLLHVCKG